MAQNLDRAAEMAADEIEITPKMIEAEQNTITFADDHRMRSLSIGYYNANAKYRIQKLYGYNSALTDMYESIRAVDKLQERGDLAKENQGELWDIYYKALVDAFAWFKDDWTKTMRPSAGEPAPPNPAIAVGGSSS